MCVSACSVAMRLRVCVCRHTCINVYNRHGVFSLKFVATTRIESKPSRPRAQALAQRLRITCDRTGPCSCASVVWQCCPRPHTTPHHTHPPTHPPNGPPLGYPWATKVVIEFASPGLTLGHQSHQDVSTPGLPLDHHIRMHSLPLAYTWATNF